VTLESAPRHPLREMIAAQCDFLSMPHTGQIVKPPKVS
jgi:hypothetical protein